MYIKIKNLNLYTKTFQIMLHGVFDTISAIEKKKKKTFSPFKYSCHMN